MNTDGNINAIERHLADCEEHDAWQDLQDQLEAARADAKEAEAYAEELERDRNALFRRVALAEEWRDHDKIRADEAEAKLATCEKYRDAYEEMGRIGTQAVRDLEAKLAECEARLGKAVAELDRLGFDFDSNLGRELKGESHE